MIALINQEVKTLLSNYFFFKWTNLMIPHNMNFD